MNPNSIWETLSRRLSRFGHHSPLRRALERVGLVKRPPPDPRWVAFARHMSESPKFREELLAMFGEERSKQIPAVWQAADRAERGGK